MLENSKARTDLRKHPRIPTNLLGRYMLENRQEYPCTIVDVSLNGVALTTNRPRGEIGETVVVYINQLGRVAGNIVRFQAGGFALKLTASTRATAKLAHRLNELQASRQPVIVMERRSEPRIMMKDLVTQVSPSENDEYEVVEFSPTGAEIRTSQRPQIGTPIKLGTIQGTVVRHSDFGVAIEFADGQDGATLTDQLTEYQVE